MEERFTIKLPPITKKNSQRIFMIKGKPRIAPSRKYKEYETQSTIFCPYLLISEPVNIEAHYYMPTRRRVDITNLESALMDVLVHAGTLEDDNCSIVVSTDGSRVHYDKQNPRTEVIIRSARDADPEFRMEKK